MPRAGLSNDVVVATAADLSDEVGLDQLTLAAVAGRLGVRLPSLYKHVAGLPALRTQLAVRAKVELAAVLTQATAGLARRDALLALATAFRSWAVEHPGRYAASVTAPQADDPADQAASTAAADAVFAALRGYDLDEHALVDAVRTLRALIAGFVTIEAGGGFALERPVDASLTWALDQLDAALSAD